MTDRQKGLENPRGGEKLTDYSVKGKVDPKQLKEISKELPVVAYVVRDRRVLGKAPIKEDGTFEVKYRYKGFRKDEAAYGADLIIGPELPGDQILRTKFERRFLSSKGFKKASPKFAFEIHESIAFSQKWLDYYHKSEYLFKWKFTYTGFVFTCSPLNVPPGGSSGCVDMDALSSDEVEAYVRLWRGQVIIAEDIEISTTGEFEATIVKHCLFPYYLVLGPQRVKVEVYQKTDAGDHILYTGDHAFENKISQFIFIDRDKVEIRRKPPPPTAGTGDYFGFERIGNVPVECIYKSGDSDLPSNHFIGYVDSSGDRPNIQLGDADLKVKDYAFGGWLHLYANLGEGFGKQLPGSVDMSEVSIKYFRIKYSYYNPETDETIGDTYVSAPFNNTRKTATGAASEFVGAFTTHPDTGDPLPHPTYIYPNPYSTDADKNWKYRGLILVLSTHTLPRSYGRYTFTLEPLDANMNSLAVADSDDCILTMLVDNDYSALTGEIEDILKDSAGTTVCGFIDLTGMGICTKSDLKVKHTVNDGHGNLRKFTLEARFGQNESVEFPLTGNTYTPSGTTPYWKGVQQAKATKNHAWQQCAYEFRIVASRRVTNGFHTVHWKEFTFHVTIISDTKYTHTCPP